MLPIAEKIAITLIFLGVALAIATFPKVSSYKKDSENLKFQVAGYVGLGMFVSGLLVDVWFVS